METDYSKESKLSQFRSGRRRPIVFCVNCGSLEVEQTAIYALECLNCRARLFWNGNRFSIARGAFAESDAAHAFEIAEYYADNEPFQRDWHFNVIRALWQFSEVATGTVYQSSVQDANVGKSGEDFEELARAWEECKGRIDAALSRTIGHTA